MPSASGIKAGKAYVEVGTNNNPLYAGLKAAEARVAAFGKSVETIGAKIGNVGSRVSGLGATMAGLGGAISLPFVSAIKAAGDMLETTSKLESVFKGDSASVKAWAENYAKQANRSKAQIQGFAADTGAILSGFGFGTREAADLSQTITQLAVDLGSFSNLKDADALQSLISGLSGQSEPLLKFGVAMSAAAIDAELLNKGIDPENATAAQKAYARLEFILARTTNAQGDAIKTAGSFNNQVKGLAGTISDLSVEIGNQLLPVANQFVGWARNAVGTVAKFVNQNAGLVQSIATVAAGLTAGGVALLGLGGAIKVVGAALGGVGSILGIVASGIGFIASPLGLVVAGLAAGTVALLKFTTIGGDALTWIGDRFGELSGIATQAFKGITDALAAGDIVLAGKVLFAGLNVVWLQGVAKLKEAFSGLWIDLQVIYAGIGTGLAKAINFGAGEVTKVWEEMLSSMTASWGSMLAKLITTMVPFAKDLAKISGINLESSINSGLSAVGINPGMSAAERQAARDQRNAQIDAQTRAANANLDAGFSSTTQGIVDNNNAGIAGALSDLEAAKAEFAGVTGQAATLARVAAGKSNNGKTFSTELGPLGGIQPGITRAMKGTETKGTFSAAALRSLNQGDSVVDVVEKGNKLAEKQLDEQLKMRRTVEQAGRLA